MFHNHTINTVFSLLSLTLFVSCKPLPVTPAATPAAWTYPETTQGPIVDDYHGTLIADPYRWLEEPDSPETRKWVDAQNSLTYGHLDSIPGRQDLKERLTSAWNYERYYLPTVVGNSEFFFHNNGLQDQSVLYRAVSSEEKEAVLNPNTLAADGTVSLAGTAVSDDAKWLAWGASDGGSDWSTWHIRNLSTGEDLDDEITWVKFSDPVWSKDNLGFFYARYPEPTSPLEQVNLNHALYFHAKGTDQAEDVLVFDEPAHATRGFGATVVNEGSHLVITVWDGTAEKNRLYVRPMAKNGSFDPTAPTHRWLDGFDASYQPIGAIDGTLYITTDKEAPKGRVATLNLDTGELAPLIATSEDTLQSATLVGERLILQYLHDAKSRVVVHTLDGNIDHELALPGIGSVSGFNGKADDPNTTFSFTSFTTPTTLYRYNIKSKEQVLYRRPSVQMDTEPYTTRQVFFTSDDGTRVPMFIMHRRDVEFDGNNPTLLYGYGGFNVSLTPYFSVARLAWLEMGGVYVIANLRGGGEYGRHWHEAGILDSKQNVFDDFFSAAEWLIEEGYTRPEKLAINGASNGGLLVGAAITQRPELFAAALPQVGVMDMLRYHNFTIGWAWASDYGRSDDQAQFPALLAYSPVHNVKSGVTYPATMVTTGDHDDRVVPAHSYKFAAALQHHANDITPQLIRIETRGGHGAGKPTSMRINHVVDQYAFVMHALGETLSIEDMDN
jgi:prolyl oligopeptidase